MRKRAAFTSIKTLSCVQIFLLVFMSFAASFLIGQQIPFVNAAIIPVQQGQTIYQNNVAYTVTDISSGYATVRQGGTGTPVSFPLSTITTETGYSLTAIPTSQDSPTSLLGLPNVAGAAAGLSRYIPASASQNHFTLSSSYTAGTQTVSAGEIVRQVSTDSSGTWYVRTNGDRFFAPSSSPATISSATQQQAFLFDNPTASIQTTANGGTIATLSNGQTASFDAAGKLVAGSGAATAYGYTVPFIGTTISNYFLGNFVQGIVWAAGMAGLAAAVAQLAGQNGGQTKAISQSVAAGILTYKTAIGLFGKATPGVSGSGGVLGQWMSGKVAGIIGLGVGAAILIATYKKESQKLVTFQCLPWEPKLGGDMCEECNKDPLRPCSEYRCKALGQACQLLNPNTDKAACAWVSKGDVTSPTIQEWAAALRPSTLQYTPNRALRPDARGVKIISTQTEDNCLPAFTNLQFGILTNEPAQCKVDYNRSINFDAMQYYFGESNFYAYNHTQRMRLPSPDSADTDLSPLLQNDGTFALFVRCRDANGNVNEDEYSINFCVSEGPDTTPPIIESTSLEDGSPIRFNADVVPIEVYTNEPATCKWSTYDREYADMESTLRCATDATQVNADLQYTCTGNLTGVQNNANKEFYFRCLDQPGAAEAERNEMRESYKLTLRGTQELSLLSAGPNATVIQASTSTVPVELFAETDDGADEGVATCYFSPTGAQGSYIEFFDTDAVEHKQILNLGSGNYSYAIRCVDAGGNAVNTNISFGVGVDRNAPMVTRIYRRTADALQITTNEDAQCYYSRTSCNFNIAEGLPFSYADSENQRTHLAEWKARTTYYIKCRDKYDNQPSPNSCSITVSGVDLSARAVL